MKYFLYSLCFLFMVSCVPNRKFKEEQSKSARYQKQAEKCKEDAKELKEKYEKELKNLSQLTAEHQQLKKDTTLYGERYRKIKSLNKSLNDLYEKVIAQNKELLNTSTAERQSMNTELMLQKQELQRKEIELRQMEDDLLAMKQNILQKEANTNQLNQKLSTLEADLNKKEADINQLSESLKEREAKVNELESAIAAQKAQVQALEDKVNKALVGFNNSELSVEQRDGKIYVSLSEKLLFKSGSTSVDSKGVDALGKLAEVLNKDESIEIFIEGHTDNVPLGGSGRIKDNWGLSVLRATSIVKILTDKYAVANTRVVPSGKGEFFPVADNSTKEGRAKNRRTEIILAPKVSELLDIINK